MDVKPLTPSQVRESRVIPPEVIASVNQLLVEKCRMDARTITISQDELVRKIISNTGMDRNKVFDSGWLDIEDIFAEFGWKVMYDRQSYHENAKYHFTPKD